MTNEEIVTEISSLKTKVDELEYELSRLVKGLYGILDKHDRQLIKTGPDKRNFTFWCNKVGMEVDAGMVCDDFKEGKE